MISPPFEGGVRGGYHFFNRNYLFKDMPKVTLTSDTEAALHGVLLVHGFGGDRRQYQPIIRFLRHHGFSRFYEFTYPKKFGQLPIAEVARQLDEFVRANVSEDQIDCVAISQGGIIARYFARHCQPRLIRRCITLGAPHHGSLTAYLLPGPGISELRPKSRLLEELNAPNDPTVDYCAYTPFDLMVVPGWSGRLPHARHNLSVWSLAHPLVFRSRATLRFILECLTAP